MWTHFAALQSHLNVLLGASKKVLLGKTASKFLNELHSGGIDTFALVLPKFWPEFYSSSRGFADFDFVQIKMSVAQIIQNQRALANSTSHACLADTKAIRGAARASSEAFVDLLESWVLLEKHLREWTATDEELSQYDEFLRKLHKMRIRLSIVAHNNTCQQIQDRTFRWLFGHQYSPKRSPRRHTLNSVPLPLLI